MRDMKTCSKCREAKPLGAFSLTSDKRRKTQVPQSQCKACKLATTKAWYAENKARALTAQAAWRETNKAQWNAAMAAVNKRRHAAKLQRVPPWFDAVKAREVYDLAAEFREVGFAVDVDHIVPLQGRHASGLHWHGNLRVCLATANRSKRNELSPFHEPLALEHNVAITYRPGCTLRPATWRVR